MITAHFNPIDYFVIFYGKNGTNGKRVEYFQAISSSYAKTSFDFGIGHVMCFFCSLVDLAAAFQIEISA